MNMFEPLSATIRPYVFIAWSTRWTAGVKPERLTLAFSRRRAPIGSEPAVLPARWEAGKT